MKTKTILLLAVIISFAAGCGTDPKTKLPNIQDAINLVVPPDFTGGGHWEHHNLYYNFDLTVTGLRKGPSGLWTWDTLTYKDSGGVWHGEVSYTKDKPTS